MRSIAMSNFRADTAGFRELLDIIRQGICAHNDRGKAISAYIQLLLTFRFYATGHCSGLCEIPVACVKFRSHIASQIIKRVSEVIARLKKNYIRFPACDMLHDIKLAFGRIGGFPNVVGAIDCTLIKIHAGGENTELFRNRKRYFSINMQAVYGPSLQMLNIAHWLGTTPQLTSCIMTSQGLMPARNTGLSSHRPGKLNN
jgi:hypothetical protein